MLAKSGRRVQFTKNEHTRGHPRRLFYRGKQGVQETLVCYQVFE